MDDYAAEAAFLSKEAQRPVKVVWTRDDDVQHDYYRPAGHHRLRAGLSASGEVTAWSHHLANTSRYAFAKNGRPPQQSEMYGEDFPVGCVPNTLLEYTLVPSAVPTGAWRSTLHSSNAFAVQSFIDELAHAAGRDPGRIPTRATRRAARAEIHRARRPDVRHWPIGDRDQNGRRAVGLAARAGGGARVGNRGALHLRQLRGGGGRGLRAERVIRVHRVVAAVDCGTVVNLSGAEAQVQGGIIDGLSAALFGEITVDKGVVSQSNFGDYRLLRIDEAPRIDVHFVPSTHAPRGLGEPPVPPIAPAVANAIFAATGRRIRRLPLQKNFAASGKGDGGRGNGAAKSVGCAVRSCPPSPVPRPVAPP